VSPRKWGKRLIFALVIYILILLLVTLGIYISSLFLSDNSLIIILYRINGYLIHAGMVITCLIGLALIMPVLPRYYKKHNPTYNNQYDNPNIGLNFRSKLCTIPLAFLNKSSLILKQFVNGVKVIKNNKR